MDQSTTTINNLTNIAEELAKPEPIIEEHQYQNTDFIRKIIKKQQNKVIQIRLKIIQKQKKQNDALKKQFRQLNQHLNIVIGKLGTKGYKNLQKTEEQLHSDTIKNQLDNEIKRNIILKKQVDQLRNKVNVLDSIKVTELYNEIKQKNKIIQKQNLNLKMYQKIQKQQKNIDLYKKQQQLNQKIISLNEELIHIKKKLNDKKKIQQNQQKNLKRQHQQIIFLENKLNSLKGGRANSSHLNRKQHENQNLKDQNQKLKENIDALDISLKSKQKSLRNNIDHYRIKNKNLEKQMHQIKELLFRKQKQNSILSIKLKQQQRKKKSFLDPLQKTRKHEESTNGLFDQRIQYRGLIHNQTNCRKFEDPQELGGQQNYKMKKIMMTWCDEHILSLMNDYEMQDGTINHIDSFTISNNNYKNIKKGQIQFSSYEFIKNIEVYCGKFIQYIKIISSKDRVLQVGSLKNQVKCKIFNFDIKNTQKPIAFLGVIQMKKILGSQQNKQQLISLGLQIKKKQVLRLNKFTNKNDEFRKMRSSSTTHNLNIFIKENDKNQQILNKVQQNN